jgi:predicted aspartyl protease
VTGGSSPTDLAQVRSEEREARLKHWSPDRVRARRELTGAGHRTTDRGMGITRLKVTVVNPADRKRSAVVECVVDSGALFSVVPAATLRKLGVRPDRSEEFTLADGSHVTRRLGDAIFRINGRHGASPVIFGEDDDATLLGVVTLESLGLMLDPLRREIRPLPMLLG